MEFAKSIAPGKVAIGSFPPRYQTHSATISLVISAQDVLELAQELVKQEDLALY